MNDNRVTAVERISQAFVSGRLDSKPNAVTDLDWLTALGMVAAGQGAHSSLLRVHYVQDRSSLEDAMKAAIAFARRQSQRRGWNLTNKEINRTARLALEYHVLPTCQTCRGQKYQRIEGTPSLSAKACPKCHGTGKRPLPIRGAKYIAAVMASLEAVEQVTEGAVRARMRRYA